MKDDKESIEIEAFVRAGNSGQTANKNLGITREYNKENRDKRWDSTKGKSAYKDRMFGDKQTYKDPISGKTLHKSQTAAQNKYHMKNAEGENISTKWAEHAAETDHINAIKDVHDKVKYNPFLTDEDFKEIVNSDENYRLLSKKDNASKGEKSDLKIILDKDNELSLDGRAQMLKEKVQADVALSSKFTARTLKNAGNEFASGAKDTLVASTIPLAAESVRKLINVAQGKESLEDAAKDMGKTTVNIAVAGGTNKLLVDVVSVELSNSSSAVLQNIASSNEVGQIIAVAAIVQETAVKYINGEIDEKEFIEQVGEKGTTMVAGMIGGEIGKEIGGIIGGVAGTIALPGGGTIAGAAAGEVIGAVLGTIITTVACSAIVVVYSTVKHMNDYKLKESQIRRLESDALKEMENQRVKFRNIMEHEYKVWDENIQSGFDQMIRCACEGTYDLQGVTDGLNKVLSVFGKKARFNSLEEYEKQLDMPLKLSF